MSSQISSMFYAWSSITNGECVHNFHNSVAEDAWYFLVSFLTQCWVIINKCHIFMPWYLHNIYRSPPHCFLLTSGHPQQHWKWNKQKCFSANLPRKTSTNSTASSTSDVSCRSNPNVFSYGAKTFLHYFHETGKFSFMDFSTCF
jgi:hypothetical protein